VPVADTLTKSERKLVDAGEERLVLEQRGAIQPLMRDHAIVAVEGLSGRRVTTFVLVPPPDEEPTGASSG
jgi:hypothetical protein